MNQSASIQQPHEVNQGPSHTNENPLFRSSTLELIKENDKLFSWGTIRIPLKSGVHMLVLKNFRVNHVVGSNSYSNTCVESTIEAEAEYKHTHESRFRSILNVHKEKDSDPDRYAVEEYDFPRSEYVHITLKSEGSEHAKMLEERRLDKGAISVDGVSAAVALVLPASEFETVLAELQSSPSPRVELTLSTESYRPESKLIYPIAPEDSEKLTYCYLQVGEEYPAHLSRLCIEKRVGDAAAGFASATVELRLTAIQRQVTFITWLLATLLVVAALALVV